MSQVLDQSQGTCQLSGPIKEQELNIQGAIQTPLQEALQQALDEVKEPEVILEAHKKEVTNEVKKSSSDSSESSEDENEQIKEMKQSLQNVENRLNTLKENQIEGM